MSGKQWEVYPATVKAGDLNGYDVRDRDQPDKRVCQRATKEDATTIAALPELLEACKAFIAAENQCGAALAFDMAEKAIAKATGANQ